MQTSNPDHSFTPARKKSHKSKTVKPIQKNKPYLLEENELPHISYFLATPI